jgi:hypothetical protein
MAQYGSFNVDERYSKILEPNLYGDAIMQPGQTFNNQYQGDAAAGLVKIYKTTRDSAVDPTTPAGDFSNENIANTLIDLRLNNSFRKSKKIYDVAANSVQYKVADETLSTAIKDVQEGWHYSALACLAYEGTDLADYTAVTKDNIKSYVLTARKALRNNHAKPNTVIASVAVYSAMLELAGGDYTPSKNENTLTTGRVGVWLGMTWYEGDLLDNEQAKYYDHAGTLRVVDLTDVDFIMYDSTTFHIVNNLNAMRLRDAESFVGTLAQVEINAGFRVSNAEKVVIKKNLLLDVLTVTSAAGASGKTAITVTPNKLTGNTYVYKTHSTTAPAVTIGEDLTSWTAWDGSAEIVATSTHKITVAEVNASKLAVKAGNTTVTSG